MMTAPVRQWIGYDWFKLRLNKGQRVSLEVVAARLGSKLDSVLRIVNTAGRELARTDDAPGLSGDSYVSLHKTRVALTFNSTLGYEAFFIRRGLKVLFVNYAGNPYENYSADERFQLTDETADYGRYERKLLDLLALDLPEPPAVARERHAFFDGRVQERVAEFVNGLEAAS